MTFIALLMLRLALAVHFLGFASILYRNAQYVEEEIDGREIQGFPFSGIAILYFLVAVSTALSLWLAVGVYARSASIVALVLLVSWHMLTGVHRISLRDIALLAAALSIFVSIPRV